MARHRKPTIAGAGQASANEKSSPHATSVSTLKTVYSEATNLAIYPAFLKARELAGFHPKGDSLTFEQRDLIVQQAITLLENFYVHLPLKRAMHAADPLQRLRLLRQRLVQVTNDARFHSEMTSIFTSVRDLHTNYLLPEPFSTLFATLPFRVEACIENGKRIYIVGGVVSGFSHPTFGPGAEVLYWNGMPIDRAVDCVADRHPGSNPEARHARGVAGLTQRPLVVAPRPDEDWVIVKYRTIEAAEFDIRLDWTIIGLPPEQNGAVSKVAVRTGLGVDLETDIIQRARRLLFAPHVEEARARIAAAVNPLAAVGGTDSVMPEIFTAREITTEYGKFGHIRIWSFDSPSDSDAFVNEFVRLAELLPQDGLIVDVRDNGGGYITAGEQLLQVLTPHMIKPEGLQFINTAWTLKMCELHAPSTTLEDFDLSPWIPSLRRGAETGATFSASFPISEPEKCNEIGQRYWGPVVLITSARCYSTTDMFAAGFQDHNIGPILGVDANTGAGGANVWEHDLLRYIFDHPSTPPQPLPESPFKSLPNGASMRAAIRRTLRVGPHAGTELEDLGVIPTCLHAMTRADHLSGNVDLLEAAGKLLAKMPKYALVVDVKSVADDEISFELKCQNADLAEVYLDGRPKWTGRVEEGSKITINLLRQGSARVEVQCFKDNKLVSSRRMAL